MSASRMPVFLGTVLTCAFLAGGASADLLWDARVGDLDGVIDQVARGADVNAPNIEGLTPLHLASLHARAQVVEFLLAAGADATARDNAGLTPLHYAATSGDERIIAMLLAHGADVNAADRRGQTPLHRAARRFKSQAVDALLAAGANARAENADGLTPLHVLGADWREQDSAFFALLSKIADRLIAHGADPSIIADGFPAVREEPPAREERDTWTSYADIGPTLLAYQNAYPGLCQRYDLGLSYQGRQLWAIKISDNVGLEEDEPEFKYIATMHGDEIVGTKMCMMLIDYMLTNYGSDPLVTTLIDEVEIWIVPLMNPDGYDRSPRTRYNAQGIDLNRNFPEGTNGDPNTTTGRATETQVIMNWGFQQSFTCSANFHGGALVVNYPFDNDGQGSVYSPTPDDDLFIYISEQYSQHNLPMWNGAFYHGITNGADWYAISGGMQDWNYRYMGCNDVTIELGNTKQPPASDIGTYWNNNRDAMLAYMATCLRGVRGVVTNAATGDPLAATVTVVGRDHAVYTDPDVGDYHRMLLPGTYQLRFEATGFETQVHSVTVNAGNATRLDVQLNPPVQVTFPNGGEVLTAGVTTAVTWVGGGGTQFHVQYTDNYGAAGQTLDEFERAALGPDYQTGGNQSWAISTTDYHSPTRSAKAGPITHNQTTWMTRTVAGGVLGFWYRVSSESGWDFFNFYVDGQRVIHQSGNQTWQYYQTVLPAGDHQLKWEYAKDGSLSQYSDTVWVDDVSLYADQTVWHDIIALTPPGATSTPWTPQDPGSDYKVRVRAYFGGGAYGDFDESNATFTVEPGSAYAPGDMDCDGDVDFDDIDPFVKALEGQAAYEALYPWCQWLLADIDGDGDVDFDDIDPFIELLS